MLLISCSLLGHVCGLFQINAGVKVVEAKATAFHESSAGVLEDEAISASVSSEVSLAQVMKLAAYDNPSVLLRGRMAKHKPAYYLPPYFMYSRFCVCTAGVRTGKTFV